MIAANKSRDAAKLLGILEQRYGKKPRPPGWSLVETLLFYVIYYSSGVTAARRAFKAFREEYVNLNEVRVSTLSEIRATLRMAGASDKTAVQLRGMLKQIFASENVVSLAGLHGVPADQVKRYLSRLDVLPVHAIDYLLLVKWDYPILPVDRQVARMASRLGLTGANTREVRAQKTLMRKVNSNSYYDFYTLFLEHASKVCTDKPRCDRCVVAKYCKHGRSHSGVKSK